MLENAYDRHCQEGRARHEALLVEAAEWRLASEARGERPSLVRQGARLAGRSLVQLGASLMRFGRAESAVILEPPPSTRSIAMN
jgi:hypothetical protein